MAREITVDIAHRFEAGAQVRASFTRAIAPGSILVLFGPSGAGKTTILRAVAGLLRPDSGRIAWDGRDWYDAHMGACTTPQERRLGYVTQDTALFPHLTVRENVEYGLSSLSNAARRQRVGELIQLVGARGLEDRYPRQLSGGQAQRIALARALAPAPALILLDEPFGALDASTRKQLGSEMRAVLRQTGASAILVTHDRLEAMAMGDGLAVMIDGGLRQIGSVVEVFRRPADPDVARSLGVETVAPAIVGGTSNGLVTLCIGEARLIAIAQPELQVGAQVYACLRAEDVLVHRSGSTDDSARNHLPGLVVGIEPEGAVDRVTVDCGFTLVAAITRQSRDDLEIRPGSSVTASIKATAIHVVPRL